MAEITECSEHSPPVPSKQEPEQREGFDPDTMRRTKPGVKRLVITLAVLVSFLVGFPFLWKSVEIYRAPLPFDDIELLSKRIESRPLQFPCSFRAIFVGFDPGSNGPDGVDFLKSSISNQMSKFFSKSMQCGTCRNNYSISVIIDSNNDCKQGQNARSSCLYQCGAVNAIDFGGDNERVDDSLESLLGDCSASDGKVYSVVAVNKDVETKAVIGKYRHAWIVGRISEHESVERIAETFVKVFANGGKEEATIHGEFMPVGADGRIVLSFNLLNADPQDWIYDWEFDKIDDHILSPIVDALSPIADISVESQVLYHTPKSSHSYWDDKLRSYIFSTSDLPFFVNSNEWHLDTSVAAGGRSKILHFVVYVPSAEECPLNLQLPNGEISKTNGYVSPMWGGVVVWNPSNCLQDTRRKFPARHKVPAEDLQKIFEVFVGQIRQLFGLKSDNHFIGTSGKYIALASEKGFTEWELDALTRQHACFNIRSCATTLSSLSRLVQSLPRMIIMDEIGKQVKLSMEAAKHAEGDASYGIYDASAVSSRQARALAEDAFFHPSIMSVSYYSFEHCFAVYSPFFLPVSLHVLLAALREWRRYQQEKRKHLTWKARTVAAS